MDQCNPPPPPHTHPQDIAEETWYKYIQRNQSVIVKLFQAQLRSTLVCPECNEMSKTFDPFMFLSLPLPVKKTRTISVYLVRTNPMEPVTKVTTLSLYNSVLQPLQWSKIIRKECILKFC